MAGGGGNKNIYQCCTDSSGTIVYLRALQGHSGRNLIDPSSQDNVIIQSNFFQNIYHVGCAINLHSIIKSALIPRGQNLSNRQTVFFLLVDPMDKNHKDPDTIDVSVPRHAQYLQKAWKRHQDAVFWVDINLAKRKGLKIYQTRSNAISLHETLPAYCVPKVVRMETGEVLHEKVFMSPRPPPQISLKHEWKRELGSEHAQRPEGQVVQQSRSFPSNQPIPNLSRDRSGQPVVGTDRTGQPVVGTSKTQTRSSDDSKSLNVELAHERSGQPVIDHDESGLEQTMLNEVNMDFRMPGLPHSAVNHAQSTSVRELIQKIENHPDRHALQLDLRQNQAYNPFSPESKKMKKEVGNIELFELFETDPKTQCKACLSYWSEGIVYCKCGRLLKETVTNRSFIAYTLDLLSIPEYVIKKGRPHGHRYAKAPENKEYYLANNMKKRCEKRDYQGIHDRFLRDHVSHGRMIENSRDDEVCRAWDVLADEDHTYHMSQEEFFHYRNNWRLHLNKPGSDTQQLRKRSDFKQALSPLKRLHQEAGGDELEPIPYWKYKQWKPASSFSSTWWQWQDSWWSS